MHSVESGEFVKALKLSGERFSTVSLDGLLLDVYDFARTIWEQPNLDSFVDHGVDHSYRVLKLSLSILDRLNRPELQLSAVERVVLGVACLIHDIGMQYARYPVKGKAMDLGEIRKQHSQLGFEMIKDVREGSFQKDRGGPLLNLDPQHVLFLHYGALVGFAHSGRTYWDALRGSSYDKKMEGGSQVLRLRLLAALVRLGDELHCEYTRIPELTWIDSAIMTPEEKAHWAACYYTQEVKLTSPGSAGLRMTMMWRVPQDCGETDVEIIRALLKDFREEKMISEAKLVGEYLKEDDVAEPCFFEFRLHPTPERALIAPIVGAVKDYVVHNLRPGQFGLRPPEVMERTKELPGGGPLDSLKYDARQFLLTRGLISGHFRLKTGWHTNKYVRCRELFADAGFARRLTIELKRVYGPAGITDIVAIGTSAIGIAALLAQMLNARLTYTFLTPASGDEGGHGRYTEYEIEIGVFPGKRVLLIDDILGVGSVLNQVVPKLGTDRDAPQMIKAFTVFSLGDPKKQLLSGLEGIDVAYLISFTDVEYEKEDEQTGKCAICGGDLSIIPVEE